MVRIQQNNFDISIETHALSHDNVGACVSFVGTVRQVQQGEPLTGLYLEHYPSMTAKSIEQIVAKAKARFDIMQARVIHRVGHLNVGENIVFVGVSSAHRLEAFQACEFIMDDLKVTAPFWKKELTAMGECWVSSNDKDNAARSRWVTSR